MDALADGIRAAGGVPEAVLRQAELDVEGKEHLWHVHVYRQPLLSLVLGFTSSAADGETKFLSPSKLRNASASFLKQIVAALHTRWLPPASAAEYLDEAVLTSARVRGIALMAQLAERKESDFTPGSLPPHYRAAAKSGGAIGTVKAAWGEAHMLLGRELKVAGSAKAVDGDGGNAPVGGDNIAWREASIDAPEYVPARLQLRGGPDTAPRPPRASPDPATELRCAFLPLPDALI